ncbi:hypothetical protein AMTR_s00143p00056630 [Amborella trichopoda]|uniref:Retrovirus-related Pol polyprotein from transposon TNT 1-94-like beta-barrel domain-containing protein n=1 Tax=Amborella trichopoda TaxID=13333 RepID=W1PDF4_AMBTC|nr:hypothetical protein AMTR_s00143p00056630 [Amborella trichopoda]
MDSGATRYITKSNEHMVDFREKKVGDWKLRMGNSSEVHILGEATVKLPLLSGGTLTLNNVLYAPDMRHNVISLSKVDKNGVEGNVRRGKMTFLKDSVEVDNASLCGRQFV